MTLTSTSAETLTVLPEWNNNFDFSSMKADDVFNWGIENIINVGLLPDMGTPFTLIVAIKLKDRKWWQSKEKQLVYSGANLDSVMRQGNEGLKSVGYVINYENSKDFTTYRTFHTSKK